MAIKGRLYGIKYGQPDFEDNSIIFGGTTYAMATLNAGWSGRFIATTTKDIYSVKLSWVTVTAAGQVSIGIYTDSGGKPSALYDANATLAAQVPVVGTQTYTFAVAPSTGLVVGNAYHIVIATTTGGTTMTLESSPNGATIIAATPQVTLTTATVGTLSSFAEVASTIPVASLLLSDGTEDNMGMFSYDVRLALSSTNLITTAGAVAVSGLKFITDVTLKVAGIEIIPFKTGTPTANLRVRIYDSTNTLVTNSTITVPNAVLITNGASRMCQFYGFPSGVVTLTAGTYRVVLDGAADTSSSNCWTIKSMAALSGAASGGSGFSATTAPDIATPVWTDTTNAVPLRLILDDIVSPGTAGMLYIPNMEGT